MEFACKRSAWNTIFKSTETIVNDQFKFSFVDGGFFETIDPVFNNKSNNCDLLLILNHRKAESA